MNRYLISLFSAACFAGTILACAADSTEPQTESIGQESSEVISGFTNCGNGHSCPISNHADGGKVTTSGQQCDTKSTDNQQGIWCTHDGAHNDTYVGCFYLLYCGCPQDGNKGICPAVNRGCGDPPNPNCSCNEKGLCDVSKDSCGQNNPC